MSGGLDYHGYHIAPRSETAPEKIKSQNGGGSGLLCSALRLSRVYVRSSSTNPRPASFARVPRALIHAFSIDWVDTVATPKKQNSKTGKPPAKVLREQAKNRREAVRDGLPKSEAKLTEFAERFCIEFVRCGVIEDAHRATELALRVPLDTTGFNVETEQTERTVKGKTVYSKVLIITDDHGRAVSEADLRMSAAANLYAMPEVKRRIRELRAEHAKLITVTAESLAEECEQVKMAAMRSGQLQVAANVLSMKAKMFGIEAGPGEGGGAAVPAASVNINIRDFSGKPAPRED